jgi:hypothetical protein
VGFLKRRYSQAIKFDKLIAFDKTTSYIANISMDTFAELNSDRLSIDRRESKRIADSVAPQILAWLFIGSNPWTNMTVNHALL